MSVNLPDLLITLLLGWKKIKFALITESYLLTKEENYRDIHLKF